ncbi:hypothetical protein HKD37_14G039408 [Glycine soja]
MIEVKSERRKQSHTVSDSAAEQKVLETKESLHTSTGVVYDSIFAMHPSGKSCNSINVNYDAEAKLSSTLY